VSAARLSGMTLHFRAFRVFRGQISASPSQTGSSELMKRTLA
jgi:hypothetical protein